MTALRFQTGGRHQTSPASLRGGGGGCPRSGHQPEISLHHVRITRPQSKQIKTASSWSKYVVCSKYATTLKTLTEAIFLPYFHQNNPQKSLRKRSPFFSLSLFFSFFFAFCIIKSRIASILTVAKPHPPPHAHTHTHTTTTTTTTKNERARKKSSERDQGRLQ